MYVGTTSVYAVSNYLSGYQHALLDANENASDLNCFERFIALKFLIWHPGWHWARILLHVYGSDLEAIQALPVLYAEYEATYAAMGMKGIEAELPRRLLEKYGEDSYAPDVTHTKPTSQS